MILNNLFEKFIFSKKFHDAESWKILMFSSGRHYILLIIKYILGYNELKN